MKKINYDRLREDLKHAYDRAVALRMPNALRDRIMSAVISIDILEAEEVKKNAGA